jgi:hypothetical protein
MMDFEQSIAAAENLSNLVYTLSERCLMAHTLRAVEWHICDEYNKIVFPITLTVEADVLRRHRSKSYVVATAYNASIFIEETLSRDQKRVCIAHECYHILEFFQPNKSFGARIEDICDQFANDLCRKHKAFYDSPDKIAQFCKFTNLPINSR